MAIAGLRKLCTPAYVYLVISAIILVVSIFQNYGKIWNQIPYFSIIVLYLHYD